MFEVGDKVRYVPNEDSPRNASTDSGYIRRENLIGRVAGNGSTTYPYRVYFEDDPDAWLPFSEAELVKVA